MLPANWYCRVSVKIERFTCSKVLELLFDPDFTAAEEEILSKSDGYPASIDSYEEEAFEERLDCVYV